MTKVGFGFWDSSQTIPSKTIRDYVNDLMELAKFDLADRVFISDEIDTITDWFANDTNMSHVVIVTSGFTSPRLRSLMEEVTKFCERKDFIVAGHVLYRPIPGRYAELHPQFLILDLERYRRLGCPPLGHSNKRFSGDLHLPDRSSKNVHDDYTPLWLTPSGKRTRPSRVDFGWNIISKGLDAGMPVINLPDRIRRMKFFLYPFQEPNLLAETIKIFPNVSDEVLDRLDYGQRAYFKSLIEKDTLPTTFIFNNENLKRTGIKIDRPLSKIAALAAGFRPFLLWNELGNTNTEIVLYDLYQRNLDVWGNIIQNWDGSDFFKFLSTHHPESNGDTTFLCGGDSGVTEDRVNRDMSQVIEQIGSYERFIDRWNEFRKLQFSYTKCDILTDPQVILDKLDSNSFLWFSNVYFWPKTIRVFGKTRVSNCFDGLIEQLRAKNILCTGLTPSGIRIMGYCPDDL